MKITMEENEGCFGLHMEKDGYRKLLAEPKEVSREYFP